MNLSQLASNLRCGEHGKRTILRHNRLVMGVMSGWVCVLVCCRNFVNQSSFFLPQLHKVVYQLYVFHPVAAVNETLAKRLLPCASTFSTSNVVCEAFLAMPAPRTTGPAQLPKRRQKNGQDTKKRTKDHKRHTVTETTHSLLTSRQKVSRTSTQLSVSSWQGCSGAGTHGNAIPVNILARERRSHKYVSCKWERWCYSVP